MQPYSGVKDNVHNLLHASPEYLEHLRRNGLRAALGVTQCARNICVYAEALPLALIATERFRLQILRVGETHAGCSVIARLGSRPLSRLASSRNTLVFSTRREAHPEISVYWNRH